LSKECISGLKEIDLKTIILDFIHTETGWGSPLQPYSEFEDLFLDEIERLPNDRIRTIFRYRFDEDGFSQYDKSHTLEGKIVISSTGMILESKLEETYTGPATTNEPYGGHS